MPGKQYVQRKQNERLQSANYRSYGNWQHNSDDCSEKKKGPSLLSQPYLPQCQDVSEDDGDGVQDSSIRPEDPANQLVRLEQELLRRDEEID